MTFNHFNSLPVKVRIKLTQTSLFNMGYTNVEITGIRDKRTVKALRDLQNKNNLTANAVIDRETFDLLDIS